MTLVVLVNYYNIEDQSYIYKFETQNQCLLDTCIHVKLWSRRKTKFCKSTLYACELLTLLMSDVIIKLSHATINFCSNGAPCAALPLLSISAILIYRLINAQPGIDVSANSTQSNNSGDWCACGNSVLSITAELYYLICQSACTANVQSRCILCMQSCYWIRVPAVHMFLVQFRSIV